MATTIKPARLLSRLLDGLHDDAWVSAAEIARHVGVDDSWVWRHSKAGDLPQPVRLSGRCTRWRWADVKVALAAMAGKGGA